MALYAKSLFAENYVVTSSVVSMSIAHASGSTIFGDSVDDTHTFTGNITASGNVSGSSTSTASFGYYQGVTTFGGADGTETLFSGSAASTGSFGSLIVDGGVDRVGIGTKTPLVNLDMPIAGGRARFGSGTVGVSGNFDIIANGGYTNAFGVWDDNSLSVARFVVQRAGLVGIGHVPVYGLLSVNGDINTQNIVSYQNRNFKININSGSPSNLTMMNSDAKSFELAISGSIHATGSITADSYGGNISGSSTSTGSFGRVETKEFIGHRPMTTQIADFTASVDYVGHYNIVGGNLTCSILHPSTASVDVGAEFEFFQTSSIGNMLFETGSTGTTKLLVKNSNVNLAGQYSGATLKKVDTDTWHLVGDLT